MIYKSKLILFHILNFILFNIYVITSTSNEENVNSFWNFAQGTTAKAQGTTAIDIIDVFQ